jgi:hypothetical protein
VIERYIHNFSSPSDIDVITIASERRDGGRVAGWPTGSRAACCGGKEKSGRGEEMSGRGEETSGRGEEMSRRGEEVSRRGEQMSRRGEQMSRR